MENLTTDAFKNPTAECDLIMEGGITSGVVYPRALLRLAQKYRFRAIGGTSAGAIAAAIAAAAEHGRESGGFEALRQLPDELARMLLGFFQPVPQLRGVFNAFIATMRYPTVLGKVSGVLWSLIRAHWVAVLVGLIPPLLYPWSAVVTLIGVVHNLLGGLVGLASVGLALAFAVIRGLLKQLPEHGFGMCPGLGQPHFKGPALTEWLTGYLDSLAGARPPEAAPHLTFGDLARKSIQLQMITTNLSMRRPHTLPLAETAKGGEPEFAFNEAEWLTLFPGTVVDQMAQRPVPGQKGYFYLPEPADLPVVVAVRMSLSFPILLATVSLYRKDRTLRAQPEEIDKLRRCVFSDGGICSDFPIHFFDTLLPTRPTFAISLGAYDARRNGEDKPENRVFMPQSARSGIALPISAIETVTSFAGAILTSARVWQDSMQSVLAGCRERIAHIALDENEGGLNLNMPQSRIDRLTLYGDLAGQRMLEFDFDEHRWRRFLVSFAALEQALDDFHAAYSPTFGEFLRTYPDRAQSYEQSKKWLNEALGLFDALDGLIARRPAGQRASQVIPRPSSTLRVTPDT